MDSLKQILENKFLIKKNIVNDEFIDLGLKSKTLWCTKNLWAKDEYDPGDYFAWGEIKNKPNDKYGSKDYILANPNDPYEFTKYNDVDNKKVLDKEDNAVIKRLGKTYDMPTKEQLDELHIYCAFEKDEKNKCIKAISLINKNVLILPLGGFKGASGIKRLGENGRYWSKDLVEDDSDYAQALRIYRAENNTIIVSDTSRHLGCNIRPVLVK